MCLSLNNEKKKERKGSKFSLLFGIMMERIQEGEIVIKPINKLCQHYIGKAI